MNMKSVVKGAAVGITAGTVCYMITKSPKNKKRTLKKRTAKAFRAVSGVATCLSSMID